MSATTTWPTSAANISGINQLVTDMYNDLILGDPDNSSILTDNFNTYDSANAAALAQYAAASATPLNSAVYTLLYGSFGSAPGFDATTDPFG